MTPGYLLLLFATLLAVYVTSAALYGTRKRPLGDAGSVLDVVRVQTALLATRIDFSADRCMALALNDAGEACLVISTDDRPVVRRFDVGLAEASLRADGALALRPNDFGCPPLTIHLADLAVAVWWRDLLNAPSVST